MDGNEMRDNHIEREANKKPSFKEKLNNFKQGAKETAGKAWNWAVDNKGNLVVLVPLGLAALKGTTSAIKSLKPTAKEKYEDNRETYVYDPHTGFRWPVKRPLTTWEKRELLRRYDNGESYDDILSSMRLLK